ncbi:MAG: hypothetical protein AAGD25_32935 [Cyanobacteria bacterium P01_F01_bin.150]
MGCALYALYPYTFMSLYRVVYLDPLASSIEKRSLFSTEKRSPHITSFNQWKTNRSERKEL